MKKILWHVGHFALMMAIPTVGFHMSYPDQKLWPFVAYAIAVYVGCVGFMLGRQSEQTKMAVQDAAVFANVVKCLWLDDPILANAVWKKAVPNVIPPWDNSRKQEG